MHQQRADPTVLAGCLGDLFVLLADRRNRVGFLAAVAGRQSRTPRIARTEKPNARHLDGFACQDGETVGFHRLLDERPGVVVAGYGDDVEAVEGARQRVDAELLPRAAS